MPPKRGRPTDRKDWPDAGPSRDLVELFDRLRSQAGQPSLTTIASHPAMTLTTRIHISRRLRAIDLPSDEQQAIEIVRALGGTRSDEASAARLWRQARTSLGLQLPVVMDQGSPRQLLGIIDDFVERPTAFAELDRAAAANVSTLLVCAVDGMAGVGKTTIANSWAHTMVDRYPDGQLYVNLRGFDEISEPLDPYLALADLLEPLVQGQAIPPTLSARSARFRSELTHRQMLIFLDNARDVDQVRPLLPGNGRCLTIVTSRNRFDGLRITEGARLLTIGPMSEEESRRLLLARVGPVRAASDPAALEVLLRVCAGLPLALSIVGSRAGLSRASLADLARDLQDRLAQRSLMSFDGGDPRTNLETVFSWSYHHLTPDVARAFRILALNPAPDFSVLTAASTLALPVAEASRILDQLVRTSLLEEPIPQRYRYHDLLSAYAQNVSHSVDSPEDRTEADLRLVDYYLQSAHAAALQLYPLAVPIALAPPLPGVDIEVCHGYSASMAWFDQEREALPLLVSKAAEASLSVQAWQLAWTCQDYFRRRGYWREWAATQGTALAAAQATKDPIGEARTRNGLGRALTWLGAFTDAQDELESALEIFRAHGDLEGSAHVHIDLGTMYELQDDYDSALRQALASLRIARQTSSTFSLAKALNNTGWYYAQLGRPAEALKFCLEGLELHRQMDNRRGQYNTLDSIGFIHLKLGNYVEARRYFNQALELHASIGDRWGHAMTLMHLGEVEQKARDIEAARSAWQHSLMILEQLNHSDAEKLRTRLSQL